MSGLVATMLSIGVLAALALIAGGGYILLRRPRPERRRGLLMLTAGLVTLVNVWLYATMPTLPAAGG